MLRIADDELTYVYYHAAQDDSLVYERVDLPKSVSLSKGVEQEIYARPILLQPFRRVYVLFPSSRFVPIPDEVATKGDCATFFEAMYPQTEDAVVESRMAHVGGVMLSGVNRDVLSFVRRTFDCPTILHPLTPLCEYFYRKSRLGNQRKVYLHLYRGRVDVVCYAREGLLLANTYDYRDAKDVVYRVLHLWTHLQLDQQRDEVHIAGDADMRREVSALLRNYILTVVPVIFPANCLVLGSDAMQISFDLTALSLCEL